MPTHMRFFRGIFFASAFAASAVFFASCDKSLGYSVALWSMPEKGVRDGDILKVHVKSNIMKTYVASLDGSDENLELPFAQISEPMRLQKLLEYYEPMRAFQHVYAAVLLDGLPMRFEPANVSRQIYRLRKNEVVKVLEKGADETLVAGANKFAGAWYRVMAQDGTKGWCFSYNLRLYDENDAPALAAAEDEADESSLILSQKWYPESYKAMFDSGKIDLAEMLPQHSFAVDEAEKKISLRTDGYSLSYDYDGIEKLSQGVYRLRGTPLKILLRDEQYISVQFTSQQGDPVALGFSTLPSPIEQIISDERERRAEVYSRFTSPASVFTSEAYGSIQFLDDLAFTWTGFYMLSPGVIPENAAGKGTVSFDYFPGSSISSMYDGVITFKFDNAASPVHFLYKLNRGELTLEDTVGAQISGALLVERSSNAKICRFYSSEWQ